MQTGTSRMTIETMPSVDTARTTPDNLPQTPGERILRWEVLLLIFLGIVVLTNTQLSPYFLDPYNLSDATFNFTEKAIVALAMTLLIIGGDIDLSVASIIALSSPETRTCCRLSHSRGAAREPRRTLYPVPHVQHPVQQ